MSTAVIPTICEQQHGQPKRIMNNSTITCSRSPPAAFATLRKNSGCADKRSAQPHPANKESHHDGCCTRKNCERFSTLDCGGAICAVYQCLRRTTRSIAIDHDNDLVLGFASFMATTDPAVDRVETSGHPSPLPPWHTQAEAPAKPTMPYPSQRTSADGK